MTRPAGGARHPARIVRAPGVSGWGPWSRRVEILRPAPAPRSPCPAAGSGGGAGGRQDGRRRRGGQRTRPLSPRWHARLDRAPGGAEPVGTSVPSATARQRRARPPVTAGIASRAVVRPAMTARRRPRLHARPQGEAKPDRPAGLSRNRRLRPIATNSRRARSRHRSGAVEPRRGGRAARHYGPRTGNGSRGRPPSVDQLTTRSAPRPPARGVGEVGDSPTP